MVDRSTRVTHGEPRVRGGKRIPVALLALSGVASLPAAGQTSLEEGPGEPIEMIVVTGSYLERSDFDLASPIKILDSEDIAVTGVQSLGELVAYIPENVGSQYQDDQAGQNDTTGTAQFNLRNLGLSSTLTLVNGRRVPLSAVTANDGSVFVDINQFPLNLVERLEVLKDGGSALYGSDAVAGVVNIITRQVDGFELSGSYSSTDATDNTSDTQFGMAFGVQGERSSVNLFLGYLDRTEQRQNRLKNDFVVPIGFPGSYFLLGTPQSGPAAGLPAGSLVGDPDCEAFGGILVPGGGCNVDIKDQFAFIPAQERRQLFATAEHRLTDQAHFYAEASYARTDAIVPNLPRVTEPTFNLIIPASHPNNPFGVDVAPFQTLTPEPIIRERFNEYERFVVGLTFAFNSNWTGDVSYVDGRSRFSDSSPDIIPSALQAALNGTVQMDGALVQWNPFASALLDPDAANVPALESAFTVENNFEHRTASLDVIQAVLSGRLEAFGLDDPLGIAFGAQYRKDALSVNEAPTIFDDVFDVLLNQPISGQPDFSSSADVSAAFLELGLGLVEDIDITAAVRYEDYGGAAGSTTDPKLSLRWEAADALAVRGSWGTSFRAPSVLQLAEVQLAGSNQTLINPFTGSSGQCDGQQLVNTPVVPGGNSRLTQEESENFNVGLTFQPQQDFSVSLDYWDFSYEDLIVQLNAQQILTADCADDGIPNSPRITYGPDVTDPVGGVTQILTGFANTATVETNGLDVSVNSTIGVGVLGDLRLYGSVSYTNSFDFTEVAGGPTIDANGQRNASNPFAAMPKWRGNAVGVLSKNNHELSAILRYVSSFDDEVSNGTINDWLVFDLQYSYIIGDMDQDEFGIELTAGVQNVFDETPPGVETLWGYIATLHDPRGRIIHGGFTTRF